LTVGLPNPAGGAPYVPPCLIWSSRNCWIAASRCAAAIPTPNRSSLTNCCSSAVNIGMTSAVLKAANLPSSNFCSPTHLFVCMNQHTNASAFANCEMISPQQLMEIYRGKLRRSARGFTCNVSHFWTFSDRSAWPVP